MTPEERMKLLLMSKEDKIPPMSPEEWAMLRPSQHPDATEFSDPSNQIMPHRRPWGREVYDTSPELSPRQQIGEMQGEPSLRGNHRMPAPPGYHRMPDGRLMRDGMMEFDSGSPMFRTLIQPELRAPPTTTIDVLGDRVYPIELLNDDDGGKATIIPDFARRIPTAIPDYASGKPTIIPDYARGMPSVIPPARRGDVINLPQELSEALMRSLAE